MYFFVSVLSHGLKCLTKLSKCWKWKLLLWPMLYFLVLFNAAKILTLFPYVGLKLKKHLTWNLPVFRHAKVPAKLLFMSKFLKNLHKFLFNFVESKAKASWWASWPAVQSRSNLCAFFLFHCNRFISDEEVLKRIRSTFTGLYTLDEVRIVFKL